MQEDKNESIKSCLKRNGINLEKENHRFEVGTLISGPNVKYKVVSMDGELVSLLKEKAFDEEQDAVISTTYSELIDKFKEGKISVEGFDSSELMEFARVLNTISMCNNEKTYNKEKVGDYTIERYPIEDNKTRVVVKKGNDIMGIVFPSVMYPEFVNNEKAIEEFDKKFNKEPEGELEKEKGVPVLETNIPDLIRKAFELGSKKVRVVFQSIQPNEVPVYFYEKLQKEGNLQKEEIFDIKTESSDIIELINNPKQVASIEYIIDFTPYKEAIKEVGNMQAHAADSISRATGTRPETVYNWAVRHNIDLPQVGHILTDKKNIRAFIDDLSGDKYHKTKDLIEAKNEVKTHKDTFEKIKKRDYGYEEAIKDIGNNQAHAAKNISEGTNIKPEDLYNWAMTHGVDLSVTGHLILDNYEDFVSDITSGEFNKMKTIIESKKNVLPVDEIEYLENMVSSLKIALKYASSEEKSFIKSRLEAVKITLKYL